MPRVHFVQKAAKDNSVVKKGESYYWWKFRFGGKRFSKTRPRPSQLTPSDKLSRIYAAQEAIEDTEIPQASDSDSPKDLADAVRDVAQAWRDQAEELRSVAEEYEESASNMEEYFQGSSQVDEIREKGEQVGSDADEADSQADAIDSIADDIENIEVADEPEHTEECAKAATESEGDPVCTCGADEEETDDWRDEAEGKLSEIPTELEVNV
jgi:hypothetical protein